MTFESCASTECNSTYHIKRLEEIMAHERAEHGLTGFRLFPVANKDSSLDAIAKEAVAMYDSFMSGDYTDISDQEL